MAENFPSPTEELLDYVAGHTLFNMTAEGQCVSLQDVSNRAISNYQLEDVDCALLRALIEKAAFTCTDLDGNMQYAVSETAGKDGPFFRGAYVPLPDGHFDYARPKSIEPEPVPPPAHNPLSITGYRHLTPLEIEQINRIKAAGEMLQSLCAEAGEHISAQYDDAFQLDDISGVNRLQNADPNRWLCEGRQKLQEGLMCLIRAIAQPSSF